MPIDKYDANETDGRPRLKYVNRTQVILTLCVTALILVFCIPIFNRMMDDRNKHVCKNNLGNISKAMLLYAEENTGRFPPTHATGFEWSPKNYVQSTAAYKGDRVLTWLTLIAGYLKDPAAETHCPSASGDESCPTEGPNGQTIFTTYGMFGPMAAVAMTNLENAGSAVLISETANKGARNTYDPLPFKDADGKPLPDGFQIGYDTSNFDPIDEMNVLEKAKFATRLAFPDTAQKSFVKTGPARHPGGIHFIYADGHIKTYGPIAAEVQFGSNLNPWPLR